MENPIQLKVVEDHSVEEAIKRTAKKLKSKYSKKRTINEKYLKKEKTKTQKVFSVISTITLAIVVTVCIALCISITIGNLTNVPPTFAGYGFMKVQTGSMTRETIRININGEIKEFDSGLDIGETIVVHSVDTKSLKIGDKIAFYVYQPDYIKFKYLRPRKIGGQELEQINSQKTKYNTTLPLFFGVQTDEIKQAAQTGATLVIHHIVEIYEEPSGLRWFGTRGSSNQSVDFWQVSERMVVGIYDDTAFGQAMGTVLGFVTTLTGLMILVLIPMSVLISSIFKEALAAVCIAKLELDVVEEKRKITDDICVRNGVGFQMDEKTKYKVLVQAEEDEKLLYMSLLWKRGEAPRSIKKYYLRKELMLRPTKRLLLVNRECEKMFNEGVDVKKIAKYYNEEKESIQKEEREIRKKVRQLMFEERQEKKANKRKKRCAKDVEAEQVIQDEENKTSKKTTNQKEK
ncbi:MAG: hypothetical protein IJD48_01805 [Clostridia bacterium]|nr:hypothetical protein [Clostridia bacterium]